MHHLARHSVACFLTRGDLYVSWEEGKAVFEELLIDAVRRNAALLAAVTRQMYAGLWQLAGWKIAVAAVFSC